MVEGYKGFSTGFNCKGFHYVVGDKYEVVGPPELGDWGFHFCRYPVHVFLHYPEVCECGKHKNRFARVRATGTVITRYSESVATEIEILEEIDAATLVREMPSCVELHDGTKMWYDLGLLVSVEHPAVLLDKKTSFKLNKSYFSF